MTQAVDLIDAEDVADLRTLLLRARRLSATAVRLRAEGRVLAVTVCTRAGSGLLGEGTVLGLRAFGLAADGDCDAVVGIEPVLDRLARLGGEHSGPRRLVMPPVPMVETWAGLAPPRSGWEPVGDVNGDDVRRTAEEGVAEVTASTTVDVRDEVWSRPFVGTPLPAAAALAAHALGFVAADMRLFRNGRWHRLSGPAGHVLTR